jgi:hypothetical protein
VGRSCEEEERGKGDISSTRRRSQQEHDCARWTMKEGGVTDFDRMIVKFLVT